MNENDVQRVLVDSPELIEMLNPRADPKRADLLRRFDIPGEVNAPLRISAQVRTEGITGPPGQGCFIFFNIEYAQGPIFWETFLYPDTGTTPWRTLSCEVRARDPLRVVELHIRFHAKGRLLMRNLRVEAIQPWLDDADALVAVFGDSTDHTCYLPTELRLTRRLELLLRDRFADRRVDVHNLAEGGEFLQRMIESGRLDRELRVLPRCDVAMIRFGLNDRGKTEPAVFGKLLHEACDRILKRFPRAAIVLSTTIPNDVTAFDEQAAAVARARNLTLIPLCEHVRRRSAAGDSDWHHEPGSRIGRRREQNPPGNPTGLGGDLHPNAYGSQMIVECYFEHLEPILARLLGEGPR